MKELNLYRLWEICNILSQKESELQEQSVFTSFMGHRSNFCAQTFDSFLEYYSFKIEVDEIIVFNNDGIPYESYTNEDYSYIPICLLSFSDEKLEIWMLIEIELQLEKQKRDKLAEKENIKQKIKYLETQLNNL
jgi:hypothetical protein